MTSRTLLASSALLVAVLIAPAAASAAPSCTGNGAGFGDRPRGETADLFIFCNEDVSSLELNGQPAQGSATVPSLIDEDEGQIYGVAYTPTSSSFEGTDSIPLKMNGSVAISVPVSIGLPTECPLQSGEFGATNRPNRSATISLVCHDPDEGDVLSATVTTPPTDGTLGSTFSLTSGDAYPGGCRTDPGVDCLLTATYQAPSGPTGYREFTITLSDDHGGSISYLVTHGINLGNAPPTCTPQSVTVAAGSSVSVPLACSDPDSGPVLTTFDMFSPLDEDEDSLGFFGPHSFTVPSGNPISTSATYTAGGDPGTDTWKYTAEDEWGIGDKASITVHITPGAGGGNTGGGNTGGGNTGGSQTGQSAGSNLSVKSKQKGSSGAVSGSFINAFAGSTADIGVRANSGKAGTLAKVIALGKLKRKHLAKGRVIFKVKLSAKGKAALKKTLKKRKTVKVKVKIVVTPPSGSGGKPVTFTRTVTLTR